MTIPNNMQPKFFHVLDATVGTVTTAATAIVAWLLANTEVNSGGELSLLLVPLIGSLIASGGMIMLSPRPETRQIVIGRAMFALLFGSATPQLIALIHPAMKAMTNHPVLLLILGAFASMVFYAISKPFTAGLYAKSKDMADVALEAGELALRRKLRADVKSSLRETATEGKGEAKEVVKEAIEETIEEHKP